MSDPTGRRFDESEVSSLQGLADRLAAVVAESVGGGQS
jgi:signal transduction protein with GAF and PtsI domain